MYLFQLIWYNTELVGCGFAAYENDRPTFNDVAQLHVCHYGPRWVIFRKIKRQVKKDGSIFLNFQW